MAKLDPDVTAYIDSQTPEVAKTLAEFRKLIRGAFPSAAESMYVIPSGLNFPVYKIGEEWVGGFAARTKGPMLYVMDQDVVTKYRARLGKLADGKSCVLYKPGKDFDTVELMAIFKAMVDESAAKLK